MRFSHRIQRKVLRMKKNAIIERARTAALKKLRSRLYKIFGCRSIAVFEHFGKNALKGTKTKIQTAETVKKVMAD